MAQSTVSIRLAKTRADEVRRLLDAAGFELRSAPHAFFQGRDPNAIITFYRSGKVVLQGRGIDAWVLALEELGGAVRKRAGGDSQVELPTSVEGDATPFAAALAKLPNPTPTAWVGVDECGKGDYFGPLIVAAARVDASQLPLLAELGVADSKALTDKKIRAIEKDIAAVVPFACVVLMPPKYNDLYGKIGNLNRLLAWGHATAAENVLEQADAELILSDQFAKANLIGPKLKERGKRCRFVQRTKAEDDPAVACASVFARAEFLRRMEQLERDHDVKLHKGAGSPVLAAARKIVKEHGADALGNLAKLHFRTTQKVVG